MHKSLETARLCAEAADAKKAFDTLILDLRGFNYITDYFVICSGGNTTQVGAISDWVGHTLAEIGVRPSHVEGEAEASWVLMDYGDVVVHIFDAQTRLHFSLEKLWGEAPRMPLGVRTPALQRSSS